MKEAFRGFVYWIYSCLPKFDQAVLWGWPDGEDSSRALIPTLAASRLRRVILFVTDDSTHAVDFARSNPKVKIVKKASLHAWLWFLTSKYVFFTHRCFMKRFPPNVISVNVWHGMPIKRLGWMLDGSEGIESTYVLATSEFWGKIMEQAMRAVQGVPITGLPRNDRLFSDKREVWRKLAISDRPDVRHFVAWLPTYRRSVRGELRQDGKDAGNPFGMADVEAERLNAYLAERQAFAVVKPHPMADFEPGQNWSHLLIVDDVKLQAMGLSLYEMLGGTDALISDISSVVIDYLVLDRPVIHAFPDLQEYRESRGFSVEPIEDYFMGPVATTFKELAASLDAVFGGGDPEMEMRGRIRELSHAYLDARATERVLEKVFNGVGK